MEKAKNRGMQFTCDQRWEDMEPHSDGRFCLSCQKPVIDFTSWDRDALIAYFKERSGTCGQFRVEQVDPALVPLATRTGSWRAGLVAAIAVLAINTGKAQAPPSRITPTEQVPVPSNHTEPGTAMNDKWGAGIGIKEDGPYCKKPEPVAKSHPRYRVFTSSRFPFLHIRPRGKFRITGCPSF